MQYGDLKFKHPERFHPFLSRYMATVVVKTQGPHTSKKKVSLYCKVCFLLPSNNKFCCQINGENQSTIEGSKSRDL
jgi:hypothetical protein